MPAASKPATAATPPKGGEIGRVSNWDPTGLISWSSVVDEREENRDLTFPEATKTYRKMRSQDAQIAGILAALTMPIRRFGWAIDPNGARDEVVERVARNLNLPIVGAEDEHVKRARNRFNHDRHLASVLSGMLTYGWQMHEQVVILNDDKSYDYKKIANRPQHTITEIVTARDGGLELVKQGWGMDDPKIPVNRLVAYVYDQEDGSWTGQSLLRAMYRPYKIKDRILRVGAINIERAGGIPWVEAGKDANAKELRLAKEFAQQFRVGESAGGALPFGWQLKFAQAAGGSEAAEYVKLQNQEMATRALAMFLNLGTTETGSRALGEGFIDFFSLQLDTIAGEYVATTNEHVIGDLVDWNFGSIDETIPLLTYTRHPNPELSIEDMVNLVNAGLIVVDDDLEDVIRARYKQPAANREQITVTTPPTQTVPETDLALAASRLGYDPVIYAAKDPEGRVTLPSRKLRRMPKDFEIAAAMNLEAADDAWQAALDALLAEWQDIRAEQIDMVMAAIGKTSTLDELASIDLGDALGREAIEDAMIELVAQGIEAAIEEADAQGVLLPEPSIDDLAKQIEERADWMATMLADELTLAAGRAAARTTTPEGDKDLDAIRADLEGLTDAFLKKQFGGALTGAQNVGRFAVMDSVDDADDVEFYSSEIMDSNTCPECAAEDGEKYPNLAAAMARYPAGGFKHCRGKEHCRGTIVARYPEGVSVAAAKKTNRSYFDTRTNVGKFGYKNERIAKNKTRAKGKQANAANPTTKADVDAMVTNYKTMHGKDPSPAQRKKLEATARRNARSQNKPTASPKPEADKTLNDRLAKIKQESIDSNAKRDEVETANATRLNDATTPKEKVAATIDNRIDMLDFLASDDNVFADGRAKENLGVFAKLEIKDAKSVHESGGDVVAHLDDRNTKLKQVQSPDNQFIDDRGRETAETARQEVVALRDTIAAISAG